VSDALKELNNRVIAGVAGFKAGSPEAHQALRAVLNDAFADGLLSQPPEWETPLDVKCYLRPEIKQIDIEISVGIVFDQVADK